MANFDFMIFDDDSFVANAKTYTKEQVLELFKGDDGSCYYKRILKASRCREVTIDDVKESTCKFLVKAPEGHDFENGCYMLHRQGRGSFKVWYIDVWDLKIKSDQNQSLVWR